MDGVLVDSEPIHNQSFRMFLNKLNIPFTEEFVRDLVGHSVDSNIQTINKKYLSEDPLNIDEGIKTRDALYLSLIAEQELKPLDGIEELIILSKQKNIKLALASSSVREQVDTILNNLSRNSIHHIDFQNVFDVTVAGDEVFQKKPAPDIYHKAIQNLGVDRNYCIAIEDSGAGITSAKANEIACIALRNQYLKENELLEADIVVNSIKEVVDMFNISLG